MDNSTGKLLVRFLKSCYPSRYFIKPVGGSAFYNPKSLNLHPSVFQLHRHGDRKLRPFAFFTLDCDFAAE